MDSYIHRGHCRNETVAGQSEILLVLAALDFVRDAFYVIEAVKGGTDAAYSDESARFEDPAITGDIERALTGDGFGCLRGGGDADHDGLRDRHLGDVVAKWLEIGRNEFVGKGGISPSGGLSGEMGGMGMGMEHQFPHCYIDDGDAIFFLVELEVQALHVGIRVHVRVERRLGRADLDLRTPVRFAHPGDWARIDIEDVADLIGEKTNIGEVCPLLGGDLLDRKLQA